MEQKTLIFFTFLLLQQQHFSAGLLNPTKTGSQVVQLFDIDNVVNQQEEADLAAFSYTKIAQYQPRHVHLAYTEHPTEMMITWSTVDDPQGSVVEYGLNHFSEKRANGSSTQFVEKGWRKYKQIIHRVLIKNLTPGQRYVYHCGSHLGWSELFFFTAMKSGPDFSPHLALYGDLGAENAQSLGQLQEEVQDGKYDAILHVGDFAYNMDTNDGLVGDTFMDQIQPIAAYIPYMTCPGNHENDHSYYIGCIDRCISNSSQRKLSNFTQYKNRFSMPNYKNYESMMYSWNLGPVHFISLSTEFYYYLQYGLKPVFNQYEWLERDLQEATKPENRKTRPWIIVYGHRPMYCTNNNDECLKNDAIIRVGIPMFHMLGLEDLFITYGIDLAIWAHEHSYERLFPLYNRTVYNGSLVEPYRNPKALTHIITGSAGCFSRHDPFEKNMPPWSGFRTVDYGYSRMKAINYTHLYFEQVSIDKEGRVIDSFHLIRENHGPYGPFPKT